MISIQRNLWKLCACSKIFCELGYQVTPLLPGLTTGMQLVSNRFNAYNDSLAMIRISPCTCQGEGEIYGRPWCKGWGPLLLQELTYYSVKDWLIIYLCSYAVSSAYDSKKRESTLLWWFDKVTSFMVPGHVESNFDNKYYFILKYKRIYSKVYKLIVAPKRVT